MRLRLFAIVILILVMPATCWAQGPPHPNPIRVGWVTACYPIGTVAPNSEVAAMGRKETFVSYAVDRFWIVMPFWNAEANLVVSRPYEPGSSPNNIYIFENQSAASVAALTGLPEESLRRPRSSYIPFGWSVVISIFALLKILSRPMSPKKRFDRIWASPRYRAALAVMFGCDELVNGDCSFPIFLAEKPPDLKAVFQEIIPALEEDGLSRFTAEGDLEFAAEYLVDRGKIVVADPPEHPKRGTVGEPSAAAEAALPDSTWKHDGLVD